MSKILLSNIMASSSFVLNFHDALLRKSDVDLLSGPHWLNDNVISFYFEYLQRVEFKNRPELLFISPQVTQCLKISPSRDMGIFLDPLKFRARKFVFMALNDCEETESPGGLHWSLLVYSRPEESFFHFDSSEGYNHDEAWKLASNLHKYISSSGKGDFSEAETRQQNNGYDCGIHVLCNTDLVSNYCLVHNKVEGCGMVSSSPGSEKRQQVLELINALGD